MQIGLGIQRRLGRSGIVAIPTWILRNVLNITADTGADAVFARGGSSCWARAWDSTLGLKLVKTAADGVASEGMRYDAGTWINNDSLGNKLHPTNTDGIYQQYDYWTAKTFSIGDNIYVIGSDDHDYALTCTIGGASVSMPVVAKTDIGSTVSDGVATWSVNSYYSNIASATENYLPNLLSEVAETNSCTDSRTFNGVGWGGTKLPVMAKDSTGIDGVSNSATTLTDNDAGNAQRAEYDITVTAGKKHTAEVFIGKTVAAATFPMIRLMRRDISELLYDVGVQTDTGVLTLKTSTNVPGSNSITSLNALFWRVRITIDLSGELGTSAAFLLFPAVDTDGGSSIAISTLGPAVFDQVDIRLNTDTIGTPIETSGATVTRVASTETSTQVLASDSKLRLRLAPEHTGAQTFLSDGTNIVSYTGTVLEVTDGVTTLSHTVSVEIGDVVGINAATGQLYYNGALVDTDAGYSPTWAALTEINNVTDLTEGSSLNLTDTTWKE